MFSIIICTYNREEYLYNALRNIAENNYPADKYEIILVNNNSTDNTAEECVRFQADYPLINFKYYLEKQQGLSYARNRGIQEASEEVLIFLDDDSFVRSDYLHNLESRLKNYPDAGAFGGKIMPVYESGKEPAWMSKWTYSWVSAINKGNKVSRFKGNSYPIGANMGFYKSAIGSIQAFDTGLGRSKKNLMGGEEKDLFFRMRKAGVDIYYFPDIEVEHIIPERRTTIDYIIRLGQGVGASEKLRCKRAGKMALFIRCIQELLKWAVTLILWFYYILRFQGIKGKVLVLFRWNVTKALI